MRTFALHLNKFFIIMHNLDRFSLPFVGMKDGIHTYFFNVEDDFFKEFDHSPIEKGSFAIKIDFDKQSGISEMDLHLDGIVNAVCDRCLTDINLPVSGDYHLYVKVSADEDDEDDVIYLKDTNSNLYLGQIIYEYICLSLPLSNTYDCDDDLPRPCDDAVLNKLNHSEEHQDDNENSNENDIWKGLKGWISEN